MRTANIVAIASLASLVMYQAGHAQTADPMAKATDEKKTYTGCLEAGATPGSFTLTHVAAETGMHKDTMSHDAMRHDSMSNDAMSKDKDAMGHDAMSPVTLTIVAKGIELSKYVGQKVSVTGTGTAKPADKSDAMAHTDTMAKSDGMSKPLPSFSVTSLKAIAATCGK